MVQYDSNTRSKMSRCFVMKLMNLDKTEIIMESLPDEKIPGFGAIFICRHIAPYVELSSRPDVLYVDTLNNIFQSSGLHCDILSGELRLHLGHLHQEDKDQEAGLPGRPLPSWPLCRCGVLPPGGRGF
jgi:hypothetical protein